MPSLTVEVLGSGGAVRTPRPGCGCRLCRQARRLGVPWERTGPSLFLHGPDVLIDTPEESALQLNRAEIGPIAAGLYSHWHPDHTAGLRVYETRNWDFRNWPPRHLSTPIYLPANVARDFEVHLGLMEQLRYLEGKGLVSLHLLDRPLHLQGWRITARPVAEEYVYLFLLEGDEDGRRVLIAMDELVGWTPPADLQGVDLAVLPTGVFEFDPESGRRRIPTGHPVLTHEATFRQTLQMVEALQPRRLLFLHIEEADQNSPQALERVAARLQSEKGWDVTFAYDGFKLSL